MCRTKAERRHNDWKRIRHKVKIVRDIWEDGEWYDDYWSHRLHQLSKGKVHCSCPLCSAKTRDNGYKISDLRKLEALQSSLDEEEINLKILPKQKEW